jgi:catechol 2,3-dioxygenase-like lactoylglutathione lyase family enzyme
MFRNAHTFSSFATSDIDEAKKFYQESLGLNVRPEHGMLNLDISEDYRVMIYPKPDFEPATYTVLNFDVKDIEAAVDELKTKGVTCEHYDDPHMPMDDRGIVTDDHMNMKIAWFKDPAGNILSIMQTSL